MPSNPAAPEVHTFPLGAASEAARTSWKPGVRRCLFVSVKESGTPYRRISELVNLLLKCGDAVRLDFTYLFRPNNKSFAIVYYDPRSAQKALHSLQRNVTVKASLKEVSLKSLRGDTVSIPVGLAHSLFKAELVTGILDIIYAHMAQFGDISTLELHHTGQFADITFHDPRSVISIPFLEPASTTSRIA